MSQTRTPQEMSAFYQSLAEQGKERDPYILTYANEAQKLVFFGSVHSNELTDPQWPVLDQAWQSFLAHPNDKILIHENQVEKLDSASREAAITEYGEVGLAIWNAQEDGVAVMSGEPDRTAELLRLKQQFSEPEIMGYYFARQMHQWQRQDYQVNQDWRDYAKHMVAMMLTVPGWSDAPSLDDLLGQYEQATGKAFDQHDEQTLYALSDPSQNPVSAASGAYRDKAILGRITAEWQAGKDICVVYGSGHAIVLEPALKLLVDVSIGQNWGEL